MTKNKNFRKVILAVIILVAMHVYASIMFPLLFALIFSIALIQPTEWLVGKGIPKGLSAFLVMLIPFILIGSLSVFYYFQFQEFGNSIPKIETSSTEALDNLSDNIKEETNLNFDLDATFEQLKRNTSALFQNGKEAVVGALSAFSSIVSFILLIPVYIFFLLISKDQILKFFRAQYSEKDLSKVERFMSESKRSMINYFKGLGLVIIIVAILNTTALYFIGIEYAILLGTFSALLIVIPYFGVALGALLPILFAFITKDSISYPLYVALSYAIIQFLEGNIITPKLLGESVELNPLVIILFLIFMGFIGGVVAMIIAVPFLSLIKIALKNSDTMSNWSILLSSSIQEDKK